jgi:starvation-inducible DNA-binding protein
LNQKPDKENAMNIDIGIEANKLQEIASGLSPVLADSHKLCLKTRNFHWNVTGPMFQTLHLMFETQYDESRQMHTPPKERR